MSTNTKSKDRDMTTGVIWKELLIFFLPIAAGTLFQQLYNAVDAIIVGKYVGTEALAAVGGSPAVIVNLFISIFVSLTTGSSVIIAQLYGAGSEHELKKAVGTAMVFFTALGLVLMLICEPLSYWMLDLLGTPADTREDAALYLKIVFVGSVPLMLLNAQSGMLRAVGDSRSPFIYMLISCLTNIVLDLVFVIVFNMGVAGVAWATVISMVVNMTLTSLQLLRTKEAYRIDLKALKIDWDLLGEMMQLGIPSALQGAMYGGSNAILQASVNALGTATVAAWALTGKLDGVYWAIGSAAGSAITTFAGQNYGAKKMDRVFRSFWVGMKIYIPLTVLVCVGILAAAPYVLPVFSNDTEVVQITETILWYFVPFYFVWTVIELISGILRGCGDVKIPVLISGIGVCLFRVVWVMTVCKAYPTIFAISICYAISWTITAVALCIYYVYWKRKETSEPLPS